MFKFAQGYILLTIGVIVGVMLCGFFDWMTLFRFAPVFFPDRLFTTGIIAIFALSLGFIWVKQDVEQQ